jgi:RecQ-mediated genome instability protein 1
MANAGHSQEIRAHLVSRYIPPSQNWLKAFIDGQRNPVALPALKQTALFRLTHSDFTTSLAVPPRGVFPSTLLDASLPERMIEGPVPVQVLDLEDMGRSRWSQVDAIEGEERGETTKGREIIRVVQSENEEEDSGQQESSNVVSKGVGPFKLVLQDANGQKVFGIELFPVQGINMTMAIGTKLVLSNVKVARGVLLLEPKSVVVLGGKIEALHSQWKASRKQVLQQASIAHSET